MGRERAHTRGERAGFVQEMTAGAYGLVHPTRLLILSPSWQNFDTAPLDPSILCARIGLCYHPLMLSRSLVAGLLQFSCSGALSTPPSGQNFAALYPSYSLEVPFPVRVAARPL